MRMGQGVRTGLGHGGIPWRKFYDWNMFNHISDMFKHGF